MTEIARKITIGGMGFDKDALRAMAEKANGEYVALAKIYGKATGYKEQASKLDPTKNDAKFIGQFEAVNLIDGSVTNAPACYLPGAASDATLAALDGVKDGEFVIFGCEIGIRAKKASPVGYVYVVNVPQQPEANDELASIRAQMGVTARAAAPALEAPKGKAKKASE